MEETLNNQSFLHAVVGACCNVLLESLPSFRNGFIRQLLKSRDFAPEGIGFAHREVFSQECIGTGIPSSELCFIGVAPHLRFAEQRDREQPKTDIIHRSTSGVDSNTHFQEILEVSFGILECLFTIWTHLNHVHQSRFELKIIIALVGVQSSRDVAAGRGRVLMKSLGHRWC